MNEETIFAAALELPAAERAGYLGKACGGDPALRKRLEGLLAASDRAGKFMVRPAVAPPDGATEIVDDEATPQDATVTRDGPAASPGDHGEDLGFLTPSNRPDSLGRIGHYEVLQVLGRGGFGIVFRAFDDVLQRVVAVKVMAPQLAATSPARKRFLREARTSAAVRHENVVQVYEVAEHPLPYLAMEFIPGETLQQRLDKTGPLDVVEALRIGRQIAEGLAAAHATDLIHRDIKPSNVLIEGGAGRVRITDFGLARAADDASISQSGIIAGTPMYMAPEQALGHKLDQRADLFSLGSVLYQMVSGRAPFRANSTVAVLKRVAEDTPRDIREIIPETPQWLCAIIAKLHAKNPDERYQSAREVADLLADCEAQLRAGSKLKDFSRIPRGKPRVRRGGQRNWLAVAVILLLSVVGLAAAVYAGVTALSRGEPPPSGPGLASGEPTIVAGANPDAANADGWVQLFNGKDLTGWKTHESQPGDWKVEQGILIGRGPSRTHLFTERGDYEDFHLLAEVRINGKGNSGVYFHAEYGTNFDVSHFKGSGFAPVGYEVELAPSGAPGATSPTGSVARCSPDVDLGRSRAGAVADLLKPDTWTRLEIVSKADRRTVLVDGKVVNEFGEPTAFRKRGHFALQVMFPETIVEFRKIAIKSPPPTPEPLTPPFKNSLGMEFVLVPKGKAWLGGGSGVVGEHGVESAREVEIAEDFYLGKYEVTQEEWQKVMGKNPSSFARTGTGKDSVKDVADADLARFPVDNVSWDDCQEFIKRVNERSKESGWVYRLPSQSEWEYACRGGPLAARVDSTFDFYGGKPTNQLRSDQANIVGKARTCEVGSYEPNRLGLYDMHGNVWEWCEDVFDAKDPTLASLRAIRGGCWVDGPENCRAAVRHGTEKSLRSHYFGLRLARVPSSEAKTLPGPKQEPIPPTFKN